MFLHRFVKVGNNMDMSKVGPRGEDDPHVGVAPSVVGHRVGGGPRRSDATRRYSTSTSPFSPPSPSYTGGTQWRPPPTQSLSERGAGRSWRLSLFDRVVSSSSIDDSTSLSSDMTLTCHNVSIGSESKHASYHREGDSRMKGMWRKAIYETLLLIRMNRENIIHAEGLIILLPCLDIVPSN